MGTLKSLALAGAAVFVANTIAAAADLPPLIQRAPPMPVEEFGGWYLRGDIGFSSEQLRTFHEDGLIPAPLSVQNASSGFDGAGIFRLGIGYKFNSWLRADLTGEYRLALPAMLATISATGMARRIYAESIYTMTLRERGLRGGRSDQLVLRRMNVEQVSLDA